MARYNEILVGRYNRRLQKLLGMKGEPPAPQLSSEIQTSLQIFTGAEERYLESWELHQFFVQFGLAGVGFVNHLRIRNPATSNVIAVCESARATQGGTQDTFFLRSETTATDFSVNTSNTNLDARGRIHSSLVISTSQAASIGTNSKTFAAVASLSQNGDFFAGSAAEEIPILPGDALTMFQLTTNIQAIYQMRWRERFLEEGERF